MKRPAFQFYPGDWRKDVELRACSLAARGLWIDLMCVAHDCEPYGHLVLNGKPMTMQQIAGQIGIPAAQVKKLLDELIENGVARTTEEGVIYSKRMVDDERIRNARAEGGKAGAKHGAKGAEHGVKGGRPPKHEGGFETPLNPPLEGELKPPPSSSSSSSYKTLGLAERGSKILTEGSAKTEKPDADASRSPPENQSISSEKSTRTTIPQPFRPTEAAVRLAEKHELDVGTEADLFVAHYESTGDFRADWDACFRKWLLRSMQHKADSEKRSQGPPCSPKNSRKFNALDAINGGDGYGNKRAESGQGRIIDIGGCVVEEGSKIQRLISD